MNRDRPLSVVVMNELRLVNVKFHHDVTLELPCFAAHDIAKIAMALFKQDNVKHIPIYHSTLWDGSERDLYANYGTGGREHILVEIYHNYIDPHFLWFWLWLPEVKKPREYPVDGLFALEITREAVDTERRKKFGEIYVAPCKIRIRTVETDPNDFLVPAEKFRKLIVGAKENPCTKFWYSFKEREFELAASYLAEVIEIARGKDELSGLATQFLRAVQAVCYLFGNQEDKAVDQFLNAGVSFHTAHLERYCDICFFFAIEAAKEMNDQNKSSAAMKRIAQQIPDLPVDLQNELSNILLSYAAGVKVGVVVLCRRVLELALSQILTETYESPIDILVERCHKVGALKAGIKRGMFAILAVAKWKGLLTPEEFEIASYVKDFGNRIHDKGGVENAVDAKYAIEACVHILRRLQSKRLHP